MLTEIFSHYNTPADVVVHCRLQASEHVLLGSQTVQFTGFIAEVVEVQQRKPLACSYFRHLTGFGCLELVPSRTAEINKQCAGIQDVLYDFLVSLHCCFSQQCCFTIAHISLPSLSVSVMLLPIQTVHSSHSSLRCLRLLIFYQHDQQSMTSLSRIA